MQGVRKKLDTGSHKRIPKIIIVEPETADCVLKSIEAGVIKKIDIKKESIMGGMSCNEMSLIPWKILKDATNYCLTISDNKIPEAVTLLAKKFFNPLPNIITITGLKFLM